MLTDLVGLLERFVTAYERRTDAMEKTNEPRAAVAAPDPEPVVEATVEKETPIDPPEFIKPKPAPPEAPNEQVVEAPEEKKPVAKVSAEPLDYDAIAAEGRAGMKKLKTLCTDRGIVVPPKSARTTYVKKLKAWDIENNIGVHEPVAAEVPAEPKEEAPSLPPVPVGPVNPDGSPVEESIPAGPMEPPPPENLSDKIAAGLMDMSKNIRGMTHNRVSMLFSPVKRGFYGSMPLEDLKVKAIGLTMAKLLNAVQPGAKSVGEIKEELKPHFLELLTQENKDLSE